jgi:ABC-2 type transport system permease protein
VAVAEVGASQPTGGQPRVRDFIRLKLRLTRNGFRGQTMRVVGFVIGLVSGLTAAGVAALGLAATATAHTDVAFVIVVCAGSMLVIGWSIAPLLFFGVDETLDPARFALLPLTRGALTRGMLASAFVGVPAVASLIASLGLVVAAWLRSGAGPGLVALAGIVLGLVVSVLASRAFTSAFAGMLRSRRMRDLAAVVMALLASSVAPIQWTITAAARSGAIDQAVGAAKVAAWTPFGAAYAMPFDAAQRRWDLVGARVVILLATIVLLGWWWSRTIESAMLAQSTGGGIRSARSVAGGVVDELIPGWLRHILRPGPYGAIVARELRSWWRDGRRRPALVSIIAASALLPITLSFTTGSSLAPNTSGPFVVGGFGFAVAMSGTLTGILLCNQFGFDGSAFASHLLSRVRGAVDLRARAAAVCLIVVPVQAAVLVAVCGVSGTLSYAPVGLGVLAATIGTGLATAAVLSVQAPYALPQNDNPFAANTGTGSVKGLLSMVALLAGLVLSAPVTVAGVVYSAPPWGWLTLPVGLAYGFGAMLLGTYIGGDILDKRAPEVLTAITPTR